MNDREKLKAQREHSRNGILAQVALALTPGSRAYVRRLRDKAAVEILAGYAAGPHKNYTRARAIEEANALVSALGYQVPREDS